MPNASLDKHLHSSTNHVLSWTDRYKISLGLGSAILYLHQEWEQCVLHRDIKPSNVMLDAEFGAKLGDFGLARLVEKGRRSLTTALAGTMGYIDPECAYTGRTNTMSDVYSFGVVLLEIASGRKPGVVDAQEEYAIPLAQWVWERYDSGIFMDAIDERMRGKFDDQEAERMLIVGLSCCQLNSSLRPSIREAVSVLLFESPLPVLPARIPVAVHMPMVGTSAATGSSGDSIATSKELDGPECM
ncbi:L-type lectin-domain containing receptor kinase IX.1 [Lolium perenne]|uniref:L-type lectin-domain containing receptor kinase IX.1 n=1 Tax=Lolium perenne TaxID=4522 RepID=UPI0021F5A5D6|nr:L-type lectin-domain containing receptor kinase IX.1-like [Lolium perenne]